MRLLGSRVGGNLVAADVSANADAVAEACKKGKACLEKKDFDAAIAAYTEAIRLDPKLANAFK